MSHQFIKLEGIDKAVRLHGAIVMCAECGEVRKIWENGEIEIKVKSKTPCKKNKSQ